MLRALRGTKTKVDKVTLFNSTGGGTSGHVDESRSSVLSKEVTEYGRIREWRRVFSSLLPKLSVVAPSDAPHAIACYLPGFSTAVTSASIRLVLANLCRDQRGATAQLWGSLAGRPA